MRAIDAELRGNISAHAYGPVHHVGVVQRDVPRRVEICAQDIALIEIDGEIAPGGQHALRIFLAAVLPTLGAVGKRVGRERIPERDVLAGGRVGRVELRIAGAVPHQVIRKFAAPALLETADHLIGIVEPEDEIERAGDIGIEFL